MVFDPLADLSAARKERPSAVQDIAARDLNPLERSLLAIDGTVTKCLEAYMCEPIVTADVREQPRCFSVALPSLQVPAKADLLERSIVLKGKSTGRVYVQAHSLIVPARLPHAFQTALHENAAGIGAALSHLRLETRREILWYGFEPLPDVPEALSAVFKDGALVRCYRVETDQRPVMLITERFPRHLA